MPNAFCVRADFGKYSEAFLKGEYVAIGWLEQSDLTDFKKEAMERLRELYVTDHPKDSALSVGQNVGQIARFLFDIQKESIVVTPMFKTEELAVGKVIGDYYYENDSHCPFPHRKHVEWQKQHVLRSALSIPLQNTLRSSLTVYSIDRSDELARAAGYHVTETKVAHAEGDIYNQVLERLLELSPDEFEILITDLLASVGFVAEHVGHQGDGGIDVRGKLDVYGLASIDLRVQVKRYALNSKINPKTISDFRGSVPEKSQAAFVTTSTFNKHAREEADKAGYKHIGLIEGKQLIQLLVEHYGNIGQELKDKLRLTRTLIPME